MICLQCFFSQDNNSTVRAVQHSHLHNIACLLGRPQSISVCPIWNPLYCQRRLQVKTGTLAISWNPGGVVGCWVSTKMFQRNFTFIQYAAIMQQKKPHFSLRWRNSFPLHMRERSWKSEGFKNTHCQTTVMKLSQTHRIIYKSHYHIYRLPLCLHAALPKKMQIYNTALHSINAVLTESASLILMSFFNGRVTL